MICPQFTEAGDSWTFMCQHGPQECYGNIVQACILNQVSQQLGDKTDGHEMLTLLSNVSNEGTHQFRKLN